VGSTGYGFATPAQTIWRLGFPSRFGGDQNDLRKDDYACYGTEPFSDRRVKKDMPKVLTQKRVAILATDGFEYAELTEPKKALEEEGAETVVVSPKPGSIRSWTGDDWGQSVPVEVTVDEATPYEFDALVLPGGVMNPDKLRLNPTAVRFVQGFFRTGKPVGAICHALWLLIEAEVVQGRRVTSWPSLRLDLYNAGAQWSDSEVVVDSGLVTSRMPADLPAFNRKLVEEISEGVHAKQASKSRASML
jgi:protease I